MIVWLQIGRTHIRRCVLLFLLYGNALATDFTIGVQAPDGQQEVRTFTPVARFTDPCEPLREAWKQTFTPKNVNNKQLLIGAGEGTTATKVVAEQASIAANYNIGHWDKLYSQSANETFKAELGEWFNRKVMDLWWMKPEDRDNFDYDIFERMDGVFDEPFAQYFPYIFATYPNSKVVLTTRTSTDWVKSRERSHPGSPLPFAFITEALSDIDKLSWEKDADVFEHPLRKLRPDIHNMKGSALMFDLHSQLVRCLVPPKQLLVLDLFRLRKELKYYGQPPGLIEDMVRDTIKNFLRGDWDPSDTTVIPM